MEAIRQIYESGPDFVTIPPELRRRRLEIIILPLEEKDKEDNSPIMLDKIGASFYGCLPDFPEREPQGEYRDVEL